MSRGGAPPASVSQGPQVEAELREPTAPAAPPLPERPRRWPDLAWWAEQLGVRRLTGGPMHPVALLMGLAAGWQWSGMRTILAAAIDPLPGTSTMVGAAALLTAALGPWLPERVVRGVTALFERRGRRARSAGTRVTEGAGSFWMLRATRDRDEATIWLSLSVLASVAGGLSLVTLAVSPLLVQGHKYLLDHFFWTGFSLAAAEWAGITALIGCSWVANGVVVASFPPVVVTRPGAPRNPPSVAAALLVGLGSAWVLHHIWMDWGLSGPQEFMLGVLPMFLLAGVSASRSRQTDLAGPPAREVPIEAPELSARGQGLIWLALVVWGAACAVIGSGWVECRRSANLSWRVAPDGVTPFVLMVGLGVAAASLHARQRRRSPSGCGMAAWAAGVGAGVVAALTSYWPAGPGPGAVQLVILALPVGYALHYVERAWLARVGSGTLGFAQLASAVLAGLAAGLVGARWGVLPRLGPMGTLAAGALLMLAFGGLVQIYEEGGTVRTRRCRLALVFASLAVAMAVFPAGARRWGRWQREHPYQRATSVDIDRVGVGTPADVRSMLLIGVEPREAARRFASPSTPVTVLPLGAPPGSPASSAGDLNGARVLSTPAFRALRLEHRRYDVVYQQSVRTRCVERFAEYSAEWLARLADRTTPGGRVIVDVPLGEMTFDAVAVIAFTFEHALETRGTWAVIDPGGRPLLRLEAVPGSPAALPVGGRAAAVPIERLLRDQSPLRRHSIQRDRLTRALENRDAEPLTTVLARLAG